MPVVPNKPTPPPAERNDLVEQLAMELTREGEGGEPLIIENPIQPGSKFFSIVVWSAWGRVPVRQRSTIILDSYRKRDQANPHERPKAPDLAMATGLTWEEAEQKNLFPFEIEPDADAEEDPQVVRDAMQRRQQD